MTEPTTPTGKRLYAERGPGSLLIKLILATEREAAAAAIDEHRPWEADIARIDFHKADADRLAEALREYVRGSVTNSLPDLPKWPHREAAIEALRLHDEAIR